MNILNGVLIYHNIPVNTKEFLIYVEDIFNQKMVFGEHQWQLSNQKGC